MDVVAAALPIITPAARPSTRQRKSSKWRKVGLAIGMPALLVGAAFAVWLFWLRPLLQQPQGDLLYIPSHQGLGVIEVNLAADGARRTAKTALFNNSQIVWNSRRKEFYAVATNGDAVSVLRPDPFSEIAIMRGDVGWNTNSIALASPGDKLYLGCSQGGSRPVSRIVAFDTVTRTHLATVSLSQMYFPVFMALAPDGTRLYVSWGNTLDVYETQNLKLLMRRQGMLQSSPLVVSSDGSVVFLIAENSLQRYRTETHIIDSSLRLPESYLSNLRMSTDGKAVLVAGFQAIYRVPMSLDSYIPIRPPRSSNGLPFQFAESSDGRALYVLSGFNTDESLWRIDIATQRVTQTISSLPYPASVEAVPGSMLPRSVQAPTHVAAPSSSSPAASSTGNSPPPSAIMDELNGSSSGLAHGIRWIHALGDHGAVFTASDDSRIEYPSDFPKEGTIEFWINVDTGYGYSNSSFTPNLDSALIFSTDALGGDVTWPGTTKLSVSRNGTISFWMATSKYNQPPALATEAQNTRFTFHQWHALGVSYGSQGQTIMLDGTIVASDPLKTQTLGVAGTHEAPVDVPTIGETVSHYWAPHQYEGGFEGVLAGFRASSKQQDWYLARGIGD